MVSRSSMAAVRVIADLSELAEGEIKSPQAQEDGEDSASTVPPQDVESFEDTTPAGDSGFGDITPAADSGFATDSETPSLEVAPHNLGPKNNRELIRSFSWTPPTAKLEDILPREEAVQPTEAELDIAEVGGEGVTYPIDRPDDEPDLSVGPSRRRFSVTRVDKAPKTVAMRLNKKSPTPSPYAKPPRHTASTPMNVNARGSKSMAAAGDASYASLFGDGSFYHPQLDRAVNTSARRKPERLINSIQF